jgi:hypothetical protein
LREVLDQLGARGTHRLEETRASLAREQAVPTIRERHL